MRKPNSRELKVLREFVGSYPEPWGRFVGAGEATKETLLEQGWIRPNQNPDYPSDYFEITKEGEAAAYS